MNENKSIVFLHLSDLHIKGRKDISDEHIQKIIDTLKVYKKITFNNVVIIISGDLTFSGKEYEFESVKKIIGKLIFKINNTYNHSKCHILMVPGNHDVNHNEKPFSISELSITGYNALENREYMKLSEFYKIANYNHCFENSEIYCCAKTLTIDGLKINVNLINNAIFSTFDEYKGQLYIPDDKIEFIKNSNTGSFSITIMHHSPDYYRDEIKNKLESEVINNTDILFYGHEHNNAYKTTSYENGKRVIIQSGGSLCNDGNWSNGSFCIGILNIASEKYSFNKYVWNNNSNQYEHNDNTIHKIERKESGFKMSEDFSEYIYNNYNKDYYIFPSVLIHTQDDEKNKIIDDYSTFLTEIKRYKKAIISGESNIGKTSLLLKIFDSLKKDHTVVFCNSEAIINVTKRKKHKIDKLIKSIFKYNYGDDTSVLQSFEQKSKEECVLIFDDFDRVDGINTSEFINEVSKSFGMIILSTNITINFDPQNILITEDDNIAKIEIKPLVGRKRRELIRKVVVKKSDDKTEPTIANIVTQIDNLIKSQVSIIPPEPFYIIQISENYINNVGEVVNNSISVFSKVFEANLTSKIDDSIRNAKNKDINVELMYTLMGKIAYYIHFNKAYPIKRTEIANIIDEYNNQYGNSLIPEDILNIALGAKMLKRISGNSESFKFENKSILAYFVAKEVVSKYSDTRELTDLDDIINKCCFNICTDILLFIIYQTNDTLILKNILKAISDMVLSDKKWQELDTRNNVPPFLESFSQPVINNTIDLKEEKDEIDEAQEKTEEKRATEFKIKDIYDWEDKDIDEFNNRLIKMMSLLHIVSKALPCFEHRLVKEDKQNLIKALYTTPNQIFMYWALNISSSYEKIIDDIMPYMVIKKSINPDKDKIKLAKQLFSIYTINLLLNLYYIPVLCASNSNTHKYLDDSSFFDYNTKNTYKLEHLMFKEQQNDVSFVYEAIRLIDDLDDALSKTLLKRIVRHGLITRNDSKKNVDRLESKFNFHSKKTLLIESSKHKSSKK